MNDEYIAIKGEQVAKLMSENKRLRAALGKIALGLPFPQSLWKCRDIASKALKQSENDE